MATKKGFVLMDKKKGPSLSDSLKKTESKNGYLVQEVPFDKLIPRSDNRDASKDLDNLAASIEAFGLIHFLEVMEQENGTYLITSGERRYRAIKQIRERKPAFFTTVPCNVKSKDTDELDEKARMIIANHEVCPPTPQEYRNGIKELQSIFEEKKRRNDYIPGSMNSWISKIVNLSERQIQKITSINNKLIPSLQEKYDNNEINIDMANKIAHFDDIFQEEVYKLLEENGKITNSEIQLFKEEDKKLKKENIELKEELDNLRNNYEIKMNELRIQLEEHPEREEQQLKEAEELKKKHEEDIENFKRKIKVPQTLEEVEEYKREELKNTISRLERAQQQLVRKTREIKLSEIDIARLKVLTNNLDELIKKKTEV